MLDIKLKRWDIAREVKEFLSSNTEVDISKLKRLSLWHQPRGENLRLSDFGFGIYSQMKTPIKMEYHGILTGNQMLQLLMVMRDTPWHYERKYTGKTRHTILHWDEAKNVSWVLCGQDWPTWVAISS
jgi:hypothetical protein